MGQRRQSRELALKMLFQNYLGKLNPEDVIVYFLSEQKASDEVMDYAREITRGVVREQKHIDKLIAAQAHNWEFDRIAGVDRAILRLAVYELLRCPEIPKSVVINEAVEMAKKYSTVDSGGFINGILDQMQKE